MKANILTLGFFGVLLILGFTLCLSSVSWTQDASGLADNEEASSPKTKKPKANLNTDLKISPPIPFLAT